MGAELFKLANRLVAQSASMGALPTLYAATAEGVSQGAYYGPRGFLRMRGGPALDEPDRKLMSDEVADKLWRISESLTGTDFTV